MTASKQRPLWDELPASVRADIETLIGGRKAMRAAMWPFEADLYRIEATVAAIA